MENKITKKELAEKLVEKYGYKKKEAKILLETDFKEMKLTNDKMRTAYVDSQLMPLKEAIKLHKNSLNIVNDLLKLRLIELERTDTHEMANK